MKDMRRIARLCGMGLLLSVFALPASAALVTVEIDGVVVDSGGDTGQLPFPSSPGDSMRMTFTTTTEVSGDLSGGDPTMGYYLGGIVSMQLAVAGRTVDITSPVESTSEEIIYDNYSSDGVHYRDLYLARYTDTGGQPFTVEGSVQFSKDTLSPSDALQSDAYLGAPPALALFDFATMRVTGRSRADSSVFGFTEANVTSVTVTSAPEPTATFLSLSGIAALAGARELARRIRAARAR